MTPHSKTNRHHASANNYNVWCSPDSIYWVCSPEIRCAELLPCEITHHLLHCQSVNICRCFTYAFSVDVLISIQAYYKAITICSPILQLLNQVLSESGSRACEILLLRDQIPPLMLVYCVCSLLFIITGIISTNYSCCVPFWSTECHDAPPS